MDAWQTDIKQALCALRLRDGGGGLALGSRSQFSSNELAGTAVQPQRRQLRVLRRRRPALLCRRALAPAGTDPIAVTRGIPNNI